MEQQDYKILIVDDEKDIIEFLGYNLIKEGYQVYSASNGNNALQLARDIKPNLILLDIMMPEMDGIELCERIRETPEIKNCIIAFLTARTEDYSQIAGFQAGADDYIAKPIKPKVLVSRIRALLKRYPSSGNSPSDNIKTLGKLTIHTEKNLVQINDLEFNLPKKEFQLLKFLTAQPSRVFTRTEIIEYLWGTKTIVGERTLDVHIKKLRNKIGDEAIKTIIGVGYKFDIIK